LQGEFECWKELCDTSCGDEICLLWHWNTNTFEWDTEDCAEEEIAGAALGMDRAHEIISHFEDSFIDSMNIFCPNMSCVEMAYATADESMGITGLIDMVLSSEEMSDLVVTTAEDVNSAAGEDVVDTASVEMLVDNASTAEEAAMMLD